MAKIAQLIMQNKLYCYVYVHLTEMAEHLQKVAEREREMSEIREQHQREPPGGQTQTRDREDEEPPGGSKHRFR